jgi:hypothetical protein
MWWIVGICVFVIIAETVLIVSFASVESFRERELNDALNSLQKAKELYLETRFNGVGE